MTSFSTQLVPSSSSTSNPRWTYDVFPSFHGKDVRNSFRSHLLAALSRKGITAFTDDEKLERGEDLDEELSKAIRESQCAVVVFSKNYAFSKWCLRELAIITDCRRAEILKMVLPVFYHIEPSNVRNQLGTFADAFAGHIEDPKVDKREIETWRAALREVGKLAGWHVRDDRPEAKVVEEISQRLFLRLSHSSSIISKGLVGVKSKVEEVISLLCRGGDYDVHYTGICGMGGIGKTTIAEEVYNAVSSHYQASCFLVHGSEEAGNSPLVYLQKQLLSKLLGNSNIDVWDRREGTKLIANRLAHKKAFIVLDNVDQEIQIKALVGNRKWFGPGSKILITSRDCHLLAPYVDNVYQVKELCDNEALQLFSWKAFNKLFPDEKFVEISKNITDCAKGLPLAIEVFASSLCGKKSLDFWKSAQVQFKENLDSHILLKLKLSFDRLECIQKQLFLDIACFFNRRHKDDILPILESFGYNPKYNIEVLEDRSLIKISKLGYLNMHDVLVQVGQYIVDQESPREPSGRTRLWRHEDIIHVLQNNDDVAAIEGICLSLSHELWYKVQNQVNFEAFSNMKRLRMLEITHNDKYFLLDKPYAIKWSGDPSKFILSNKLCYMNWFQYPLKSLPTTFQPNNLVKLILPESHLETLWEGRMGFQKLQAIDLSYSKSLIETPDFTEMLNLQKLVLSNCERLTEVHQSIGSLKWLKTLDLDFCKNLQRLPDMGNMLSLTKLKLRGTQVEALPSSIINLPSIETLELAYCNKLKEIPQNWGNMEESLKILTLKEIDLRELPSSIVLLKKLKELNIDCGFSNPVSLLLPKSFLGLSSLTSLSLRYCNLLDEAIPNDLCSLPLERLNLAGNKLTKIPQLTKLVQLELNGNSSLRMLPKLSRNLRYLDLGNCPLLDTFYMDTWTSNEMSWTSDNIAEEIYFGYDGESYKNLQLYPKSPHWIRQPLSVEEWPRRVAWGPTRGYEIPKWFKQRSNNSLVKVQICKDVYQKLRGLALFVVYEVREADPFERKRKVRKLDKHESTKYRGFYQRNPTFPEIVCQLQFSDDHPTGRELFVLRAPYVTTDGLHGVWVVIPAPKNSNLRMLLERGIGDEASIVISSRNVDVKEFGVSLVQEHDVIECCEVLSAISPHGFGSTILKNLFSSGWELALYGAIKEGYFKGFRKRRLVKAAAQILHKLLYPLWELPVGCGIGKGSLEEFLERGIVKEPVDLHQRLVFSNQATLSCASSQASHPSLPRKRKFMQQELHVGYARM